MALFGPVSPPRNLWGDVWMNPMDPFSSEVDAAELYPWLQENYNRGYWDGNYVGNWNNMAMMNMVAARPRHRQYHRARRSHWHSHVHLPVGLGYDPRFPGAYGGYGAINAGFGGGLGGGLGGYGRAYGAIGGGFGGHLAGGFGGGFLPGGNVVAAPQLLIGAPGVQMI